MKKERATHDKTLEVIVDEYQRLSILPLSSPFHYRILPVTPANCSSIGTSSQMQRHCAFNVEPIGSCQNASTRNDQQLNWFDFEPNDDNTSFLHQSTSILGAVSLGNTFLEPIDEQDSVKRFHERRRLTRHGSLMFGNKAGSTVDDQNSGTSTAKCTGNGQAASDISKRRLSLDSLRHSIREKSGFLRSKLANRRMRNRLVQKSGVCNISLVNVPKQSRKFFSDIFTTIVDVKWRWCLFLFACSYIATWLLFTLIFFAAAYAHGDFVERPKNSHWDPCVANAYGFVGILMFSVESQSTIGYGFRYPTEQCPVVIVTVCVQNMLGCLMQTLMAGIVFAKLARPKKRAETIMFSKNAVICMRDGRLCLLFRVGDMRKSQLAEAHVRLQMIKKLTTREGELLPFHQFDMDVGYDEGLDRVMIMWPITICHVIDEESPLYDIGINELHNARFEIIAILEGVAESTGSTVQARTSYLPNELMWGHRFQKLVTYQRDDGEYRIDYKLFHETYHTNTPPYSAKQLDEMREAGDIDSYSGIVDYASRPDSDEDRENDKEIEKDEALHSPETNRITMQSQEDPTSKEAMRQLLAPIVDYTDEIVNKKRKDQTKYEIGAISDKIAEKLGRNKRQSIDVEYMTAMPSREMKGFDSTSLNAVIPDVGITFVTDRTDDEVDTGKPPLVEKRRSLIKQCSNTGTEHKNLTSQSSSDRKESRRYLKSHDAM